MLTRSSKEFCWWFRCPYEGTILHVSLNLQKGTNALLDLEDKFLRDLQQAPSRVHNALRNVGKFPLIITTNMDELLERFLWKTGNGGEKLRLDQVGKKERRFDSNVSVAKYLFFLCQTLWRSYDPKSSYKSVILFAALFWFSLIKLYFGHFSETNDTLFVSISQTVFDDLASNNFSAGLQIWLRMYERFRVWELFAARLIS